MTLRELLQWFGQYPWILAAVFLIPPALVLIAGLVHGRGNGGQSPWRYLYSVLIYMASVPGMGAAVVTTYAVVFAHESLLDMNLMVSLVPIVSMVLTLVLARRNVDFDQVPGFDRLFGLMVVLAITFILILGIAKTRIWLFFGASIFTLALLVAILIAVLMWGAKMLTGTRSR
jgi:hypothetical protein